MALGVYDLGSQVVLYLVAFQRRVEDGEAVRYEDTRSEVLALISDLDRQSHTKPGLWDAWVKARVPLVYLIDEVMNLNCNWSHRQDWANDCLEVALLGHPEALGGENFYKECDDAIKELEQAERHARQDIHVRADIVALFYVALQVGFKGRFALDLDKWREYKTHVFSKLPSYAKTRAKELFPECDDHTVVLDPNYEPVVRLLYVLGVGLLLLALYFAATGGYWSQMISDLKAGAAKAAITGGGSGGTKP
ncbi:MAG: DotU family type IV/VI secretion system protein [Planctomycetes bacterium]|nr:DotU family type IV/VI secretion system protein [Planctomycetota bacterium]